MHPNGTYTIEVPPGRYTLGYPCTNDRANGFFVLFALLTVKPPAEVVVSGQNIGGLDFGVFLQPLLNGYAFEDANGDGVLESGEPGIDGCTATLTRLADGNEHQASTNGFSAPAPGGNASGAFSFFLEIGTYRVLVGCPNREPTTATTMQFTARSNEDIGDNPRQCALGGAPADPGCLAAAGVPEFGFTALPVSGNPTPATGGGTPTGPSNSLSAESSSSSDTASTSDSSSSTPNSSTSSTRSEIAAPVSSGGPTSSGIGRAAIIAAGAVLLGFAVAFGSRRARRAGEPLPH
jgi:hypothetical protein